MSSASIEIDLEESNIEIIFGRQRTIREKKGRSLISFPPNFTVIDIETTGLDPSFDEIIEIGAIKIRGKNIVDKFSSLVKPQQEISSFITDLTGITNEMVHDAPKISKVLPVILSFIENDIIVGHNVNFDINFLYDNACYYLDSFISNNFVDTMRLSRWLLKDLAHHRLIDISDHYSISSLITHRSLADCEITFNCYNALRQEAIKQFGSEKEFIDFTSKSKRQLKAKDIHSTICDFDESHPFYKKVCAFTGKLEKMTRVQAMQEVVDLGGICNDGVNKSTNYLILGNFDYCSSIKDGKSSKHKKAEQLVIKGQDLLIISENVFYDMLSEELSDETN